MTHPTPTAPQQAGEKIAPVQGFSAGIPWSLHLEAYDAYSKKWRPQPAMIEGGCRGGFSTDELDEFIPGWRDRVSEITKLRDQLRTASAERDGLVEEYARLQIERDAAMENLHAEIAANLEFRADGGALPEEDMPTFCARLIAERDVYREELRCANEAATSAESRADRLAEDAGRMAGWIMRRNNEDWPEFMPDHACAECRPHSALLVDGFVCGYHIAKRFRAAIDAAVGRQGDG